MPPEMAQRMKTMMAENQEHGFQTCLTAEDVKRPKEDFFAGKGNECRYEHFTMGGGKIDAAMHCGSKPGGSQVMQMAGTYSPESYQMQTSMKMEGRETPQGAISMSMRVEAQRIGECKAGRS
jgi:outer membrane receptor for ferric coprogen and ferric-rhodotorulic acid